MYIPFGMKLVNDILDIFMNIRDNYKPTIKYSNKEIKLKNPLLQKVNYDFI